MGISISLCMIVKNEESNLARCLDSVKDIADEINIVDTGSTDNTIELAKRYTDRVYHFEWIDDFSAARNFSFSKATKEYILWLDADDIITPENREKLKVLKSELPPEVDYVTMLYHYSFDDDGKVMTVINRERLLKREMGFKWTSKIHETICVSGNRIESDIFITHAHKTPEECDSSIFRNMRILENVIESGDYMPIDLSRYGTALCYFKEYDKALEVLLRVINMPNADSWVGVVEPAYLTAFDIYCLKEDHESAGRLLKSCESFFTDKSEYYSRLGYYYQRIEANKILAYDAYCKALDCKGRDRLNSINSRDEEYYYFIPLSRMGLLSYELKMYDVAIQCLEEALVYKPTDEKISLFLSKLKA